MIIYTDLLNPGIELCSDALPSTTMADGAILAIESKKVKEGGEKFDTGANASKEEAEEGTDDEVKTVINIVASHGLVATTMEKKTYVTLQTAYWKNLLAEINKKKNTVLFGDESKIPAQTTTEEKEEFKKRETAAIAKLKGPTKTEFEQWQARFNSYKKNFPNLQKFVKDEILGNFSEYEFYIGAEPTTTERCMIVPARYIGEAISPTFYYFLDGLVGEKA